jgi:predicted membrane protein
VTIDLDAISSVPPTKVYNLSMRFVGALLMIISGAFLMLSLISNMFDLITLLLCILGLVFGWFILKKGVKKVD